MTNLKWQSAYSALKLGSSLAIVPLILAASESHEIILYGYVSFVTALTIGLDLGIQSVGIARISKSDNNVSQSLIQVLLTLRRLYVFLFCIAIIALMVFAWISDDIKHYSTWDINLLFIHSASCLINLLFMWQDALLIGTNRLSSLRKIQSLSLALLIFLFYSFSLYFSPITSFVLANAIFIIVLRLSIRYYLNKNNLIRLPKRSGNLNYSIFLADLKYVLPASLVALIAGRVVYFLGLTNFSEKESALFVTLYSILSMTNFAAMVYKDSKAFELTKEVSLSFPILRYSALWQLGVFSLSFLTLFIFKSLISDFRPEIEILDYSLGAIFYLAIFFESLMGLISLVLLNNQDFRYVKWFLMVMLLVNSCLGLFYFQGELSLVALMIIVGLGWFLYCLILLRLLYDHRQNEVFIISSSIKSKIS